MRGAGQTGAMDSTRGNPNQTYLNIAWGLTLVLVIWAIIVGNTQIPSWTIAIPAVRAATSKYFNADARGFTRMHPEKVAAWDTNWR